MAPGGTQETDPAFQGQVGPGSALAEAEGVVRADLRAGDRFAGHRIERLVGIGGVGAVYRARNLTLERIRALKVLSREVSGESSARARFRRECRLAASLEHPHVVTVFEAGEAEGRLFLAMRYVEGRDLGRLIRGEGRLAPARVASLLGPIADALDAAHASGLVHRDVKPANILVEGSGADESATLADFGLSLLLAERSALTASGQVLGTVDYAAPEQIAGEAVDSRADVYSLACVVHHALTGSPPFVRDAPLATMFAHVHAPRPGLRELAPSLPRAAEEVLMRGMAVSPAGRYATASAFMQDLRAALEDPSTFRLVPSARQRIRAVRGSGGRLLAWGAVALAAAGLLPLALGLRGGGHLDGASGQPSAPRAERLAPSPAPPAAATTGARLAAPPVSVGPGALYVWVARPASGIVEAVDPETGAPAGVSARLDIAPRRVAGGFGSIWVLGERNGSVRRVDPEEEGPPRPLAVRGRPVDLAVSEAAVWVVSHGPDSVWRIDPASNEAVAVARPRARPLAVAAGDRGVWTANRDGTLVELGQARGEPKRRLRVGAPLRSLAVGEGRIWGLDATTGETVGIDPTADDREPLRIDVGAATSVVAGLGWAWVGRADGRVVRVDPRFGSIAGEPIRVGRAPLNLAVARGGVWAADGRSPVLTQIEP